MDEKFEKLLKFINFDDRFYNSFENAYIKLIEINELDVNINLYNASNVNVITYEKLRKTLEVYFKEKLVKLYIEVGEVNFEFLNDYIELIFSKLIEDNASLIMYKELPPIMNGHRIVFQTYNGYDSVQIKKFVPYFDEQLKMAGFSNLIYDFSIVDNNDTKKKIEDELNALKNFTFKKSENVVVEEVELVTKEANETTNVIHGKTINTPVVLLQDIKTELPLVTVEVKIFSVESFSNPKINIITLKATDNTDSFVIKVFAREKSKYDELLSVLKSGKWIKVRGPVKDDLYSKELVINAYDINDINYVEWKRIDDAEEKRVELHTHTMMSQMDGVVSAKSLIAQAKAFGHQAIAITDHNNLQSFPDAFHSAKDIKILYGVELNMVDDSIDVINRERDLSLLDETYVVFDFETTGFNARSGDSIIEVGAVKMCNGDILETFCELINPNRELPRKITEITGITDKMLENARSEEEVMKDFIEWFSNYPMVAHNAKFDASFMESAYAKYDFGTFDNTIIDTLELSRLLDPSSARHNLSVLTRKYKIEFDETSHHRADYDAKATALILYKMFLKLIDNNINNLLEIKKLINHDELYKMARPNHINIIAKDKEGLKNLFKLVTLANTKYFYKIPRILRREIEDNKDGLLLGSGCYEGEIFKEARSKSDEELASLIDFYDYIEIQPMEVYSHLVESGVFASNDELRNNILKIIRIAKERGKLVVATGDVHHLNKDDKIYREIIANQKVPGGGRHPLKRKGITRLPDQYFMNTKEMLEAFDFLDEDLRKEIVITNTNKIADMVDVLEIIKKDLYSPRMKDSAEETKRIVYDTAKELYSDELPLIISERLEKELSGIIDNGYDVMYLIAQRLVKKSNDEGYIVGSRGSVGSSLVATFMGITEVNPLPAHYLCTKCKLSIFNDEDDKPLGATYSSGYDLEDKMCPHCNIAMKKEGQDMPFATFLGFKAEKVPDIDLNFSGEYQAKAHDYTKVLFGEKNVFRAGTIGTVAEKTAFGFTKGYFEDNEIYKKNTEIERLSKGCVGVKRTTGQHPGGIIVIPDYMDIYDFSPYQYPADDTNASWYTTHFDFHAIHDNVLKLDILGHDDPTVLKMLSELSDMKIEDIPLDDKKVYSLLSEPTALGVTEEEIMCPTGTLGLPELGTKFVINMLKKTKPSTFGELVKISGLSHGTDVWAGNAEELIENEVCAFKEVIGCRDDIMVYLMYNGLEPTDAFKIMEFVRKGMPTKVPDVWRELSALMEEKNIEPWYIESCRRIKYMFPKAHAVAYVMMAIRVAWFKVHMPIFYYCAYLSIRCHDFDIEAMMNGYDDIKKKIIQIRNKGYEASNKENNVMSVLEIALEMTARGYKFGKINLEKSDAVNFIIDEDNLTLIPPFRTIDGLGDTVALNIMKERSIKPFSSIEDFQNRSKVSSTILEHMKLMKLFGDLRPSNQLSLF